jgi:hypothetical protein
MAAPNDFTNRPNSGMPPLRRHRRPRRRREADSRPTRVELRIDTLTLPPGYDGYGVQHAVEAALHSGLAQRLAYRSATPANHHTVARPLSDPLSAEPSRIGNQVAVEVIRAVLP